MSPKPSKNPSQISIHWLIAEPDWAYPPHGIPISDFYPLAHRWARPATTRKHIGYFLFLSTGSSQSQTFPSSGTLSQGCISIHWLIAEPDETLMGILSLVVAFLSTGSSQSQTECCCVNRPVLLFLSTGSSQSQTAKQAKLYYIFWTFLLNIITSVYHLHPHPIFHTLFFCYFVQLFWCESPGIFTFTYHSHFLLLRSFCHYLTCNYHI